MASQEPVWLGDTDDNRLRLSIVGYEFPSKRCSWDANWLLVHAVVQHGSEQWEFTNPCLLTTELLELIDWLRAIPDPDNQSISFLEPLLAFQYDTDEPRCIRLTLRGEALPEGQFSEGVRWGEGLRLTLRADAETRNRFVEHLVAEARAFPER